MIPSIGRQEWINALNEVAHSFVSRVNCDTLELHKYLAIGPDGEISVVDSKPKDKWRKMSIEEMSNITNSFEDEPFALRALDFIKSKSERKHSLFLKILWIVSIILFPLGWYLIYAEKSENRRFGPLPLTPSYLDISPPFESASLNPGIEFSNRPEEGLLTCEDHWDGHTYGSI